MLLAPLSLGNRDYFYELVPGRHFPCVQASVYGAFGGISHTVFVMFAPAQFALGNLDAFSFCATLASQLTHDHVISCFSTKWCSDPAVDSRPAQS